MSFEFLQYKVADAMTPKPVTIGPDARLRDVQRLFENHDFNGVPVIDDAQRLLGVVTKFDLLKAFTLNTNAIAPPYSEIMEKSAESVMTREPECVAPDMPLSRLLQKLVEMRTKSFPVLDSERVVGMISREDVLAALRHATEQQSP